MRARIRTIVPLAFVVALTAACGESGSSGTGGGGDSGGAQASGDACAPVPGDELVILEDDQDLQNADNIIPAVNAETAAANPALLPALDAISAELTTDDLIELNAAVARRESAEDVAAGWVEENLDTSGLEQGSGAIAVGGANFPESTLLANLYADVLQTVGFDATVQEVGSRELYLQGLRNGEIDVFPEYLATLTEFIEGDDATQIASADVEDTLAALEPLATDAGLVVGEPAEAATQNAFAVTQAFADELGVTTLSELAEACGDGSLVLGAGPECPTRPFCQPGLEETYGLEFADFREFDSGGPLTKAAIQQGEVSIGLAFTTDAEFAQ